MASMPLGLNHQQQQLQLQPQAEINEPQKLAPRRTSEMDSDKVRFFFYSFLPFFLFLPFYPSILFWLAHCTTPFRSPSLCVFVVGSCLIHLRTFAFASIASDLLLFLCFLTLFEVAGSFLRPNFPTLSDRTGFLLLLTLIIFTIFFLNYLFSKLFAFFFSFCSLIFLAEILSFSLSLLF